MVMAYRGPVNVFLSSLNKDESLLQELEIHLSLLKRQELISTWYKRQVVADTDWAKVVDQRLEQASIILLLVTADFLASDYCYDGEMQRALQRHDAGLARVIPIIVRPCDWKNAPFARLKCLPRDGKAITTWENRDEAWLDVIQGVRQALEELLPAGGEKEAAVSKGQQSIQMQVKPAFPAPYPPVWNVPYRYSPFFTGRGPVVEQLFANFTSMPASGTIPFQVLTGLGGLGKTQTAVEYAYRYRQHYQAVLWIRAETEEDLVANFKVMAELLGRPATHLKQRESLLASMQEWFRNTTDWLLIFDNADNLALVEPFLPRASRGHLLLTSRATAGEMLQSLPLNPLAPDDGALCILRRAYYISWSGQLSDASSASVKAAWELSQLMDGLPLALEQAGAYIETTGRSVREYLELYRSYRPEIQRYQYGAVPSYREPVAFAWSIARERVRQENPAAIELLHLCAYLFSNAIPSQMLTRGASVLGSTLRRVAAKETALDRVIALLLKHSLLRREVDRDTDTSRFSIHPVLQEILKDSMDPRTQRLWAERTVRLVAHALPFVEWQIMQPHVRSCLPLIAQWKMSFREADLIRQYATAEHMQQKIYK